MFSSMKQAYPAASCRAQDHLRDHQVYNLSNKRLDLKNRSTYFCLVDQKDLDLLFVGVSVLPYELELSNGDRKRRFLHTTKRSESVRAVVVLRQYGELFVEDVRTVLTNTLIAEHNRHPEMRDLIKSRGTVVTLSFRP